MVSINDVAKQAGVSNATVSRVLSGYTHVSEKTRQKVMQAVQDLNYQPDKTARRLRSQSTSQVIGLIVSDIQNPHFGALVRGVEDHAYQSRMNVILCNTDEHTDREDFYISLMQSERAAGLLVNPTSPNAKSLLERLQSIGTAVVLLDNILEGFECDSIGVMDRQGAYDIITHLIQMGVQNIGVIAGRQDQITGYERLQGYYQALSQAKISVDSDLIKVSQYTVEGGYDATLKLIKQGLPDALFTCSNSLTIGALQALTEYHIKIPDDVRLVCFDDLPYADFFQSPLTAVAQPSYNLGLQAVQLIEQRMQNPDKAYENIELACEIKIRQSCGIHLPVD